MIPLRPLLATALLMIGNCSMRQPIQDSSLFTPTSDRMDGKTKSVLQFGHELPRRHSTRQDFLNVTNFQLRRGDLHFVASAERFMAVFGIHVHIYDLAAYLNVSSPLWTNSSGREADLKQTIGSGMLVIVPKTRLASRSGTADICMELDGYTAKYKSAQNKHDVAKRFCDLFRYGPAINPETELLIYTKSDHVEVVIAGERMKTEKSPWLSEAVTDMYFGTDAVLPKFSEAVWAQLDSNETPLEVTDPVIDITSMHLPVWAVVIIAFAFIACTCCCCGFLGYFCARLQAKVQGPSEKL